MIVETVKRDVSSFGMMQVATATIAPSKKIFDMFSDQTYANKPLAIMRELVANGIDAHKSAGCPQTPVEVHLPTQLDPTCRITDYGTGMPHDFVMTKFMAYTDASTKDQDNEAIGGMGIGSKSPFSYVDQYTLRVVHQAVLSIYTMFKDTNGIPAIGLVGQTTTDEPNGVQISFPVEADDVETFHQAAQDALQYFTPLPKITNGTVTAPDYTYVGNGWAMRPTAGELGIIMAGVRYPGQASAMAYELRTDARIGPLLEYGLDLTLPIGACTVAMSREALSYVPKTSASIRTALENVIDDVVATFSTFFDHCSSKWEAMELLATETGFTTSVHSMSARAKLLHSNARYKGEKLATNFRFEQGVRNMRAWMILPAQSRRSANCPGPAWGDLEALYTISPHEIGTVIIDDLPDSPKSKATAKIKAWVNDDPQVKKTLVLRGDPAKLVELFHNPTNVVYTSTLPEPAPKAKGPKAVRPRVRMFNHNGGNDLYTHRPITNLTPGASKKGVVTEVPYIDQPSSGIMVAMESYELPNGFQLKMQTNLVKYSELSFVNAGDAAKIKATFEDFNEVFDRRLKAALAALPDLPARIALSSDSTMRGLSSVFRSIQGDRRYDDLPAAAKARPLGRLFDIWKTYVKPLTSDQTTLGYFVTAALPTGVKPKALYEKIDKDVRILLDVLDLDDEYHRGLFFKNL